VGSHRRRAAAAAPALVDDTKTARAHAARFAPLLLAHYCALLLHGWMAAEARAALRPGVWALVESVDGEGLQAMSDSLGRDERAVWGAVYGEWRRVRGGRET